MIDEEGEAYIVERDRRFVLDLAIVGVAVVVFAAVFFGLGWWFG